MARHAAGTLTRDEANVATAEWLNEQARSLPFGKESAHTVVFVQNDETNPFPPAPAWYDPKTGDAYVHLDRAGIDVDTLLATYENHERSMAKGLLVHEVAHSRWSDWLLRHGTFKAMSQAQHTVATMFEEMRVEYRALNTNPDFRKDLRASLGIIVSKMTGDLPTTRYDVARAWAIVFGRSVTTVIDDDELRWMDNAARTVLGDDDVDYLSDVLQEAIELDMKAGNLRRMIELAQEWIDIVGTPPDEEGLGDGCGHGPGEKSDGEGEGKGTGGKAGDGDEEGEAAGTDDLSSSAGVANSVESTDDVEEGEATHDINADEAEMIKAMLDRTLDQIDENWDNWIADMANAEEWAKRVFGDRDKRGKSIREFAPDASHARHVLTTSKVLEAMAIPAITKVTVASQLPPGRLRSREALRASAERSMGRMTTAKPWEGVKRRHAHSRPIVVGIATDTSGSMRWAEGAVADFAYTWANAGRRIGARTAAVTFGDHALSIAAPGEVLTKVRRKDANGGTEHADQALAALDGGLKLSHQNGTAKLLVVVSDGHLVISHESLRVIQRLREFRAGGTKVIWVTPEHSLLVRQLEKQGLAEIVKVDGAGYSKGTFDLIQDAVLMKLRAMTN
jgi:hypothetical protein